VVSSPRHEGAGDKDSWADVAHEWHPRIAYAILKHWGFPPTIIAAVGNQNDLSRETRGGEELPDVLIAATALVPCVFYRERLSDTVTAVPPFRRLGLDAARCQRLMADSAQQIRSLQAALSS